MYKSCKIYQGDCIYKDNYIGEAKRNIYIYIYIIHIYIIYIYYTYICIYNIYVYILQGKVRHDKVRHNKLVLALFRNGKLSIF